MGAGAGFLLFPSHFSLWEVKGFGGSYLENMCTCGLLCALPVEVENAFARFSSPVTELNQ